MTEPGTLDLTDLTPEDSFRRARFRARLEQVLARVLGRSASLLEYEAVRKKLRADSKVSRGLQNVPIDAIVGSVDRYQDFTRSFLPRQDHLQSRWTKISRAMTGLEGLPPVEVYQVGQAYFVIDGNHRVSVARQSGAKHIQAYVTEVQTRVPLTPDMSPDEVILQVESVGFEEHTALEQLRPDANVKVSAPGQYQKLEEHISVHQYFMGLDQKRDVPYQEATTHWYDTVYLPVVEIIRQQGILRDFADRTEADLYLWIAEHRAALADTFHWDVSLEAAADDLVGRFSPRPQRVAIRVGDAISHAVVPRAIVPGPPPGVWRLEAPGGQQKDRLFPTIVVATTGTRSGWQAVDQALTIAQREGGWLTGLHVVQSEEQTASSTVQSIEAEFLKRCQDAGVLGRWMVQAGEIAPAICEWTRWSRLAVLPLKHPPRDQPIARLSSGFRAIVQSCAVPILAVPGEASSIQSALLAYDGSPRAREALYVSTYLTAQWHIPLCVVSVNESDRVAAKVLREAETHLKEHGVKASFVAESGPVGEAILKTAQQHQSALIVMGGYGFNPVLQIALGSAVDQVVRQSQQPVLICR